MVALLTRLQVPVVCYAHAVELTAVAQALDHGSVLRRTLPVKICAGDLFRPVTGVFLGDSSTRCGPVPVCSAFFSARRSKSLLSFQQIHSTGYPGLECVSLNSHDAANDLLFREFHA